MKWDFDSFIQNSDSTFVLQLEFEGTKVNLQGQMMYVAKHPTTKTNTAEKGEKSSKNEEELMYFLCTVDIRVCWALLSFAAYCYSRAPKRLVLLD